MGNILISKCKQKSDKKKINFIILNKITLKVNEFTN